LGPVPQRSNGQKYADRRVAGRFSLEFQEPFIFKPPANRNLIENKGTLEEQTGTKLKIKAKNPRIKMNINEMHGFIDRTGALFRKEKGYWTPPGWFCNNAAATARFARFENPIP